jgi:F-type H+-transporting ATPase subunit b
MDQTFAALGELMLKALPTFLLVVALFFYLKAVYFKPMAKVLRERYEATEGARKLAQASLARADEKTAEYEEALRSARAEIYREQEQLRQALRQDHANAIQEARHSAGAMVQEAQGRLAAELEAGKATLQAQSDSLAEQITDAILRRRPS